MTTACFLDAGSVGDDLDFSALHAQADHWQWHETSPPEAVAERLADVDVALTNKVVIDATAMAAAPRLRLICVTATGVNNVDLEAARAHGITVVNAVGYATPAVTQHVLALLLALATGLPRYDAAVRDGRWQGATHFCLLDYPITELAGRTLGIVGYGELGHSVGRAARALGMEILVAARPRAQTIPADRIALPELLARVDALTLHCPLTEATRNLIGADALARMKPEALLINTARGGIVDEAALATALRNGTIAGAGVDVLSQEPPIAGNPLLAPDIPNLIVTPHTAWASRDARQRLIDQVAGNIAAFTAGRPRNVVTAPDKT